MTAQKLDQPGRNQAENATLPDHLRQQKPIAEPPPQRRQSRKVITWVVLLSLAVLFGLMLLLASQEPDATEGDYSSLERSTTDTNDVRHA